jgi:hypothetical protein
MRVLIFLPSGILASCVKNNTEVMLLLGVDIRFGQDLYRIQLPNII